MPENIQNNIYGVMRTFGDRCQQWYRMTWLAEGILLLLCFTMYSMQHSSILAFMHVNSSMHWFCCTVKDLYTDTMLQIRTEHDVPATVAILHVAHIWLICTPGCEPQRHAWLHKLYLSSKGV